MAFFYSAVVTRRQRGRLLFSKPFNPNLICSGCFPPSNFFFFLFSISFSVLLLAFVGTRSVNWADDWFLFKKKKKWNEMKAMNRPWVSGFKPLFCSFSSCSISALSLMIKPTQAVLRTRVFVQEHATWGWTRFTQEVIIYMTSISKWRLPARPSDQPLYQLAFLRIPDPGPLLETGAKGRKGKEGVTVGPVWGKLNQWIE